ncbi:MAG TPA: hypothetical protein VGY48_00175 [Vicinamibacterales bacterium]|nr:hypothetical protein [Vicinamibacterales bacterium]
MAGLPVTEANISDDACHPEARIKPDFFSDLSQLTWRDLRSTDTVHYTVTLHQVLSDEPCRDVPAGLAVETAVFERQRSTLPAGVTT